MRELKQSTAATIRVFMTDSTDRTAGIAGLTLTITAAKAGDGSFSSLTPTSQQSVGNGFYDIVLSATHTNTLGEMSFHVTGTGADPSDFTVKIVSILTADCATPTNITAGTITTATNVTTVNGLAANVITAASIATDAGAEIASAVWDLATSGHTTAATFGAQLKTLLDLIATYIDTEITTLLTELAKVPKSDSTVTWNATALASINAECDTALADYDAPTNTEMVAAFTEIKGATWAVTDTLEAIRDRGDSAWVTGPSAATIATEILDNTEMENSESLADQIRIMRAESAGKVAVSGATVTFRDAADTKARITATTDSNGQRTAVTVDGT